MRGDPRQICYERRSHHLRHLLMRRLPAVDELPRISFRDPEHLPQDHLRFNVRRGRLLQHTVECFPPRVVDVGVAGREMLAEDLSDVFGRNRARALAQPQQALIPHRRGQRQEPQAHARRVALQGVSSRGGRNRRRGRPAGARVPPGPHFNAFF